MKTVKVYTIKLLCLSYKRLFLVKKILCIYVHFSRFIRKFY